MGRPSTASKDKEIIDNNPGKSPYELLTLGISQKKYEELAALEETQAVSASKQAENITPVVEVTTTIQPITPVVVAAKDDTLQPAKVEQKPIKAVKQPNVAGAHRGVMIRNKMGVPMMVSEKTALKLGTKPNGTTQIIY